MLLVRKLALFIVFLCVMRVRSVETLCGPHMDGPPLTLGSVALIDLKGSRGASTPLLLLP